jgi:hypothetical protein
VVIDPPLDVPALGRFCVIDERTDAARTSRRNAVRARDKEAAHAAFATRRGCRSVRHTIRCGHLTKEELHNRSLVEKHGPERRFSTSLREIVLRAAMTQLGIVRS